MADNDRITNRADDGLADLFARARADAPRPGADLTARILADAAAVQADLRRQAAPGPRRTQRPQGPVRRLRDALGGWPALAGLGLAALAGLWLGLTPPAFLPDGGTMLQTAGYDLLETEDFAALAIGD